MPIYVDSQMLSSAEEIFNALGQPKLQAYADHMRNNLLTSVNIHEILRTKSMGSIEATTCINVCYFNSRHILIHHHDFGGRNKDSIVNLFKAYFPPEEDVQVVLIGGYRTKSKQTEKYEHDYSTLKERTRGPFESLVKFWNGLEPVKKPHF